MWHRCLAFWNDGVYHGQRGLKSKDTASVRCTIHKQIWSFSMCSAHFQLSEVFMSCQKKKPSWRKRATLLGIKASSSDKATKQLWSRQVQIRVCSTKDCSSKKGSHEREAKKKRKRFFIEDELLSHIIQCFLEAWPAHQTNRLKGLSIYIYSTYLEVSSQHGNTRLQEHSRD